MHGDTGMLKDWVFIEETVRLFQTDKLGQNFPGTALQRGF